MFASFIEAALGAATLVVAASAWRRRRRGPADADVHLPILLAATLAAVSLAGWPLFYFVLQGYVGRWPGVMCIQGVTRVGTGSEGAAGMLPTLVVIVEALRPAAVFATGGWLALHAANRRTRSAPFTGRVLAALAAAGALCRGRRRGDRVSAHSQGRALSRRRVLHRVAAESSRRPGTPSVPRAVRRRRGAGRRDDDVLRRGAAVLAAVVWSMPRGDAAPRRGALAVAAFAGVAYLAAAAAFASDVAAHAVRTARCTAASGVCSRRSRRAPSARRSSSWERSPAVGRRSPRGVRRRAKTGPDSRGRSEHFSVRRRSGTRAP